MTDVSIALRLTICGLLLPACWTAGGSKDPADSERAAAQGDTDSTAGEEADSASGADGDSDSDGASCSDLIPCGGDVVGTWTAVSSCLAVSGAVSGTDVGLTCPSLPITGSLRVTGTWTADTDGTSLDGLSCSGELQLTLAPECFFMSEARIACNRLNPLVTGMFYNEGLEFASVSCEGETAFTPECNCTGAVDRALAPGRDTYTASDSVITTSGGLTFSYCVTGDTMTLTPLMWSPDTSMTTTGTVVLRR